MEKDEMEMKTDTAGIVVEGKMKLSNFGVTWNTRLQRLMKHDGNITICSHSIANMAFLTRLLRVRSENVTIIVNSKYARIAQKYKNWYPDIEMYVSPFVHAKLVLAEPDIVFLSSENLGNNQGSFDATIGLESAEAYEHYRSQVDKLLRKTSTEKLESEEYFNA